MDEYVKEIIDHAVLLVGLALVIYWVAKRASEGIQAAKNFVTHVIDERVPKVIKDTLSNGGGEIIRRIVKSENDEQTRLHDIKLNAKFAEHEKQEDDRFKRIEEDVLLLKARKRR